MITFSYKLIYANTALSSSIIISVRKRKRGEQGKKKMSDTLIMILGGGNSTDANIALRPIIGKLAEYNYNFLVYDMPGHGANADFETDIDDWSKHVYHYITKERNERNFFIIGVGLAGHIVYRILNLHTQISLETNSEDMDKRILGIVQGSPPKSFNPKHAHISQYVPKSDILATSAHTAESAAIFVRWQFPENYDQEHPEIIKEFENAALATRGLDEFVGSLFNSKLDEMKVIEEYPYNTLMLHAKDDDAVNPEYLDLIDKKTFSGGKYHVMGGTHQLATTNPDGFIDAIIEFINIPISGFDDV